jgi:hypothetical protein
MPKGKDKKAAEKSLDVAMDYSNAHGAVKLAQELWTAVGTSAPQLSQTGTVVAGLIPHLHAVPNLAPFVAPLVAIPAFVALRRQKARDKRQEEQEERELLAKLEELKAAIESLASKPDDSDFQRRTLDMLRAILQFKTSKQETNRQLADIKDLIFEQRRTAEQIKDTLLALRAPNDGKELDFDAFLNLARDGFERLSRKIAAVQTDVRQIDAVPLYTPEPITENPYYYATAETPLVGRATERGYLEKFLKGTGPTSWMLMIGGAGSGKSRLGLWAVERAKQLGYDAGFLTPGTDFDDWARYVVRRDTLVVVDYALRRTGDLGLALKDLFAKRNGHRIRVLVLERAPVGLWYSQLTGVPGRFDPIGETGRTFDWMDLGTMGREGVVALFDHLAARTAHDATDLADRFLAVEPTGRPLFAAFYWKAVQEGTDTDNWTPTDLARRVLEHELDDRWRQVDHPHANLAAVACARRGISRGEVKDWECLKEHLPTQWDVNLCATISGLGGGFDEVEARVPGFEPDTLAELYVLERLDGKAKCGTAVGQAGDTQAVVDCLWLSEAGQPGMVDLLQRALRNFGEHPAAAKLMELPDGVPDEVRQQALGQAAAVAVATGESAEPTKTRSRIEALLLAQALFNATFDRETTPEGRAALDGLRALADAHPDEPEVRLALAQALTNAVGVLERDAQRLERLDELRALADAHPDEPEVRLALAGALYNATHGRETAPEGKAALDELRTLAITHPDEPEVRLELAKALNIAVFKLESDEERTRRLDELRTLAVTHPDEPEVRLRLSMALYNATHGRETTPDGRAALDDLRTLAVTHPDEPEVRLELAKALTNAVLKLESDEERTRRLDELRTLASTHPDEPEVRLTLAKALTNAVLKLESDEERTRRLDELRTLASTHPDEPEVRLTLAKALNNAVAKLGSDEERTRRLDELRTLADDHPDEPEVRLELAKALCNQAVHCLKSDDPQSAVPFLVEAASHAAGHEDDPEWALVIQFLGRFLA